MLVASRIVLLALCLASLLVLSSALLHPRPSQASYTPHSRQSVRSPAVYLNDFTSPSKAQAATRVHLPSPFADRESYAGYVTVNASCGSNIFFWFFPAIDGNASAPLLMWLNGGPGSTSMYGLFNEMGPFSVAADGQTLVPRAASWNNHYHMVFVDNPVGTGFSYTEDESCFSENMSDVSVNLYSFLEQFFTSYPDYLAVPFYVTGESYAGKYVPSISSYIHSMNLENPKVRIRLTGLSVGDGLMDPITQVPGYGELLFNEGMASYDELLYWQKQEAQIVQYLKAGQNDDAFKIFDAMLNGDFYSGPTYYQNTTGLSDYFNFNQPSYTEGPYEQYLNLNTTRAAIHVGSRPFWSYNHTVELHLIHDWFRSVADVMPTLLQSYKVLVYNGQLDIILSAPACERFLWSLQWTGAKAWQQAGKVVWRINATDGQPAGYAKKSGNFVYVVVRGAGHLLPQNQPERALDMITRFVDGRDWH